jgi:hypothetical protein
MLCKKWNASVRCGTSYVYPLFIPRRHAAGRRLNEYYDEMLVGCSVYCGTFRSVLEHLVLAIYSLLVGMH